MVELFAYDARLSNVTIAADARSPTCRRCFVDRHAIQQIIVNLVQNALHSLRSRQRAGGRIEIETSWTGTLARLVVRDDGPGVPPERARPPVRGLLHDEGPRRGHGARARDQPRRSPASTAATSSLEDRGDGRPGAQFTPPPPARRARAGRRRRAAPPHVPEGVPAHVLVVDDEAPVRDSLVAQLCAASAPASTRPRASTRPTRHLGRTAYDVLLVDVRLHGRSGIEIHRDLRAGAVAARATRIVFMTGDLVNDDVVRAVRATGRPLLEKPFTGEELRRALLAAAPPTGPAAAGRRRPAGPARPPRPPPAPSPPGLPPPASRRRYTSGMAARSADPRIALAALALLVGGSGAVGRIARARRPRDGEAGASSFEARARRRPRRAGPHGPSRVRVVRVGRAPARRHAHADAASSRRRARRTRPPRRTARAATTGERPGGVPWADPYPVVTATATVAATTAVGGAGGGYPGGGYVGPGGWVFPGLRPVPPPERRRAPTRAPAKATPSSDVTAPSPRPLAPGTGVFGRDAKPARARPAPRHALRLTTARRAGAASRARPASPHAAPKPPASRKSVGAPVRARRWRPRRSRRARSCRSR